MIQKKKWGQVFLQDQNIVDKIIQSAAIEGEDTILEIGVGKGVLSSRLAEIVDQLWLVEIDSEWLQYTMQQLNMYSNINAVNGDILDFDIHSIQGPCKVVANIPYYLSAKIIQYCVGHADKIKSVTLMMQHEFAKRLMARPMTKAYGSLSVFFQIHFDVSNQFKVSRNCFFPIPNVDSIVMTAVRKELPKELDMNRFDKFIQTVFHHKRKSIWNNLLLSQFLDIDKVGMAKNHKQSLRAVRADALSVEQLIALFRSIEDHINNRSELR